MKIAVAQIDCSLGEIQVNCSKISAYAKRAKEAGCQAIVFPEMIDTGYNMSVIEQKASSWEELPFTTAQTTSSNFEIYLICGISEREENNIFNSLAVFSPQGKLIGKYRKTHMFNTEPVHEGRCFASGDSLATVTIEDMTWGLSICYDLRFPELSRSLALRGADVVVVCAAWPFPRSAHWNTLASARAIENQVYFVAANRVGANEPLTFCGSSRIIDPYGIILASGAEDREELLIAEISKDVITNVRRQMPVLEHRRAEIYKTD